MGVGKEEREGKTFLTKGSSSSQAHSWWHCSPGIHQKGNAATSKPPLNSPLGSAKAFIYRISSDPQNSPVGISPILQMNTELGLIHIWVAAVLMGGWAWGAARTRTREGRAGVSQGILFIDPKRK